MNNQTFSDTWDSFTAALPPVWLEPADKLALKENRASSDSDKLSETLERHTVVLDQHVKHRERSLRQQLLEGIEIFHDCRENEGRIFFEYCEIYKAQRLWTKVGTAIGLRFGYSLKKVERMRDAHKEKLGLRKPRKQKQLETAPDPFSEELEGDLRSRQLDELLVSRYHLREALAPFTGRRLIEVLTQLIEAESFSTWGLTEEFTMHIVPGPSSIVITNESHTQQVCPDELEGQEDDSMEYVN
jgi:hypothetical protein